jgi:hypothetical protein
VLSVYDLLRLARTVKAVLQITAIEQLVKFQNATRVYFDSSSGTKSERESSCCGGVPSLLPRGDLRPYRGANVRPQSYNKNVSFLPGLVDQVQGRMTGFKSIWRGRCGCQDDLGAGAGTVT